MNEVAQKLCGAFGVNASDSRFIFFTDNACAARGTDGRQTVFLTVFGVRYNSDNLGNDVTCLADNNSVSESDIFFINKILIMKSCP